MAALEETPSTPLPDPLTLPALQRYVARVVAERGFTREVDRVFILFVEELGELAEELAARVPATRSAEWREPGNAAAPSGAGRADSRRLSSKGISFELADVTLYLADLANGLKVDLGAALAALATDRAPAARVPTPVTAERTSLSEWQAWAGGTSWAAETPRVEGTAWLGLVEATGRLARNLRQRWAGGTAGDAAAAALGDALRATLSLADEYGVDLSAAVREKEQVNSRRTWTV